MSQHDILVLASVLKNLKFVAKNELARVPFFGRAAASVGTVYIERQNRKSSFDSYRQAAEKIREGACVVVFAEGSRGDTYSLRPFKKGPFVLAVHVHAPIVPVVLHGTREVHPKGTIRVNSGRVDVHFLEPIPTEGMTYEDRNALAKTVYDRMAALPRRRSTASRVPAGTPARLRWPVSFLLVCRCRPAFQIAFPASRIPAPHSASGRISPLVTPSPSGPPCQP